MVTHKFSRILSFLIVFTLTFTTLFTATPTSKATASTSKSKISINITDLTITQGKTKRLKITGTKKAAIWKSSKPSVAQVNKKGRIKAIKAGTAKITAKILGKKFTCNVQVSKKKKSGRKILIAYFSQTGTTKSVARKIQKLTGGDIIRIREKNKYPSDYDKTVTRAKRESDQNARPKITSVVSNMSSYDTVFIGYPIWWHSTPKVIDTFLSTYNLKGKTVIPFCTSGGSDIQETVSVFNKLCKNSKMLEGYTANSASTAEISRWLQRIGILKSTKKSNDAANSPQTPSSDSNGANSPKHNSNILVVYFSWSSNTERMAETIKDQTGADIYKIVPQTPYPDDYSQCTQVALQERDSNARPAIANLPASLDGYDTILIGYPIWWHTAPMIIGSFLESYDLNGINIYPFSQSASMDTEQFNNSTEFIKSCAANAAIHDGLFTSAGNTQAIIRYLNDNSLIKKAA